MSASEQARALMNRHHHQIKNRQQSMLGRINSEVGMPAEASSHWSHIQGKPSAGAESTYGRSRSALS
jgi:hypothetical protein